MGPSKLIIGSPDGRSHADYTATNCKAISENFDEMSPFFLYTTIIPDSL